MRNYNLKELGKKHSNKRLKNMQFINWDSSYLRHRIVADVDDLVQVSYNKTCDVFQLDKIKLLVCCDEAVQRYGREIADSNLWTRKHADV